MKIHYKIFTDNTLIVTLHSYIKRVSEPLAPLITLTIFALELSLPMQVSAHQHCWLCCCPMNQHLTVSCVQSHQSPLRRPVQPLMPPLSPAAPQQSAPHPPPSQRCGKKYRESKSQYCITILNKKWFLWKVLLLLLLWSFFQKELGILLQKIQSTYALTCWVYFFCIVYQ